MFTVCVQSKHQSQSKCSQNIQLIIRLESFANISIHLRAFCLMKQPQTQSVFVCLQDCFKKCAMRLRCSFKSNKDAVTERWLPKVIRWRICAKPHASFALLCFAWLCFESHPERHLCDFRVDVLRQKEKPTNSLILARSVHCTTYRSVWIDLMAKHNKIMQLMFESHQPTTWLLGYCYTHCCAVRM